MTGLVADIIVRLITSCDCIFVFHGIRMRSTLTLGGVAWTVLTATATALAITTFVVVRRLLIGVVCSLRDIAFLAGIVIIVLRAVAPATSTTLTR